MGRHRPPVQLKGRLLTIFRLCWLLIAISSIGLLLAAVPLHYRQLMEICTGNECTWNQLSPVEAFALQNLGFSLSHYAIFGVTLSTLFALIFTIVALLIFLRQSGEWIALLTGLWLVTFGTMAETPQALAIHQPLFRPLVQILGDLGWVLLLPLFLFTFPDGRFIPRWTFLLVIIFLALGLIGPLIGVYFPDIASTPLPQIMWFSMMLIGIGVQVYRYRRVSDLPQRQQTKWVVSGLVLTALGLVVWIFLAETRLNLDTAGLPALRNKLIEMTFVTSVFLVIALTLGISILRYRLWDIDVIIRRTLIYSAISVTLALVYAGSVVVLQQVFQAVTGRTGQSQAAIVVSTLAVAALFSPLRKRVQERIDRRFYRRRYDAERVLADFADRARRETDLDALTAQLLEAVQSSLQPERVSIWLKGTGLEKAR